MEEGDEPHGDGPEEPFFGDKGSVLKVRSAEKKVERYVSFYVYLPFLATLLILLFIQAAFLESLSVPLIIIAFMVIAIALIYQNKDAGSVMLLELTRDGATLSTDGNPPKRISQVSFDGDTVVNVVLNDVVQSDEFGHLFGWSFEDEKTIIKLSCHEGWEVWDIQNLREPIYALIAHHGMDKGPDLRYYQEGLRGVMPIRSRYQPEAAPEPPTI